MNDKMFFMKISLFLFPPFFSVECDVEFSCVNKTTHTHKREFSSLYLFLRIRTISCIFFFPDSDMFVGECNTKNLYDDYFIYVKSLFFSDFSCIRVYAET